jgi:DNA-binding protein H-NS
MDVLLTLLAGNRQARTRSRITARHCDWRSALRSVCDQLKNSTVRRNSVAISPTQSQTIFGVENSAWEATVNYKDLAMMSADELWSLHEEVRTTLSTKLDSEKQELERRLALLNGRAADRPKARRPYPKVHPKYRNPERPSETWSGRGRQPHWVGAQLRSGKKVDDLLIAQTH